MKAQIIDGLVGEKLRTQLADFLDSLEKSNKAVKFVTQSESPHGTGGSHHITLAVWYE